MPLLLEPTKRILVHDPVEEAPGLADHYKTLLRRLRGATLACRHPVAAVGCLQHSRASMSCSFIAAELPVSATSSSAKCIYAKTSIP
jgi:hypothetical protein